MATKYHSEDMTVSVELFNSGDIAVKGDACLYLNDEKIDGGCLSYPETDPYLEPGSADWISIPWSLANYPNNQIVNGLFEIKATVDGKPIEFTDSNTVDIYWAEFATGVDGYEFPNDKEFTEIDWLTSVKDLFPGGDEGSIGQVWNDVWDIFAKWGGVCAGMASTSIAYQQEVLTIPNGRTNTYGLNWPEARENIIKFHRNQVLNIGARINTPNHNVEFERIEELLSRSNPKPAEIGLYGKINELAHSVVAYKTISVAESGIKHIFIYDNQWPFKNIDRAEKFNLDNTNNFKYRNYDRFFSSDLDFAKLSDEETAKEAVKNARESQLDDDVVTVYVGSPVEPLIVDASERKIGVVNGSEINQIPNARMDRFDDKTVFILPNGGSYSFQATGYSTVLPGNTMLLAYQRPVNQQDTILEVSFLAVPIESGLLYKTDFGESGDDVPPVTMPDGSSLPPDDVEIVVVERTHDIYQSYIPIILKNR